MNRKSTSMFVVWVIFIIYIAILLRITVIRHGFNFVSEHFHRTINLDLFSVYIEQLQKGQYFGFVYLFGGNILMFTPFGFMLPYLTNRFRSLPKVALCGLLFSVVIEASQYIFDTGESEADDLILNTLGAVIGYLVYRFYQRRIATRKKAADKSAK